MKTNQEMIRYIGQYSVTQRTSDGFFDANSYLHSINGNSDCDSDIDEYIEQSIYVDFISKENGITYMPYFVFVDFALYISNDFSLSAFSLCMDDEWRKTRGLIEDRVDNNLTMLYGSSIRSKKGTPLFHTYITNEIGGLRKIGRSYNVENRMKQMRISNPLISCEIEICFDIESELHNIFNEKRFECEWFRLSELDIQIMNKLSNLINEGFITNFDNLIAYLRKQYAKRNYPQVFIQ